MAHIFNPVLDGENFDEIDLGEIGLMEGDRIIDRVIINELEYPEFYGSMFVNDMPKC